MKVILLKDIPKVGQRNEVREVKDGFAFNMLIPRGLARQATPDALKVLEKNKAQEEKRVAESAEALSAKISGLSQIEMKVKANDKGHLFAGVGKEEISKETGIPTENIILESPIKEVGEHEIEIRVGDKSKKVKITLSPIEKRRTTLQGIVDLLHREEVERS